VSKLDRVLSEIELVIIAIFMGALIFILSPIMALAYLILGIRSRL